MKFGDIKMLKKDQLDQWDRQIFSIQQLILPNMPVATARAGLSKRQRGCLLAYYHSYISHGTEASTTLAKMILNRAPTNMSKVYFGLGDSDANETNAKLVSITMTY